MPKTPPRRSKRNKDNTESTTEADVETSEPRSSSQSYSSALEAYSTPEEPSTDFDIARLEQLGESSSPTDTNQTNPSSFQASLETAVPTSFQATAVTNRSAPSGLDPEGSSGDSSDSADESSEDSSIDPRDLVESKIAPTISNMVSPNTTSPFDPDLTYLLVKIFDLDTKHVASKALQAEMSKTYEHFQCLNPSNVLGF